jgi:putative membrane protein
MTRFLTKLLFTAVAALVASYVLAGVRIDGFLTAMAVALVLALLNTFVKPILILLTLPITVFTLGIFLLVINILIIKWAASLVYGFEVEGWWSALLFSLLLSIVTYVIEAIAGDHIKK